MAVWESLVTVMQAEGSLSNGKVMKTTREQDTCTLSISGSSPGIGLSNGPIWGQYRRRAISWNWTSRKRKKEKIYDFLGMRVCPRPFSSFMPSGVLWSVVDEQCPGGNMSWLFTPFTLSWSWLPHLGEGSPGEILRLILQIPLSFDIGSHSDSQGFSRSVYCRLLMGACQFVCVSTSAQVIWHSGRNAKRSWYVCALGYFSHQILCEISWPLAKDWSCQLNRKLGSANIRRDDICSRGWLPCLAFILYARPN